MFQRLKDWARGLRREATALWFVARDPATPWWLRGLILLVAAYVLSPIDLIPDFIPVLGYLDEVILLPIAIWLLLKLVPPQTMAQARDRAARLEARPRSRLGAVLIVLVWILAAWWLWRVVSEWLAV